MMTESKERDYRCVQCGFRIKTLYIQYSPGNIRLVKCQSCKAVSDEYIECEFMILLIDLILHKAKAYRHLFYNMFSRETLSFEGLLWRLSFGFLLLDAYRLFILSINEGGWWSSSNSGSLIWSFGKIWMDVLLGNFLLFCILLLGTRIFLNASVGMSSHHHFTSYFVYTNTLSVILKYKDILLAVLVSSYFKMFLMAMMVWEFPSSVIFIIDLFVLSSNIVAIKVITDSTMIRCLAVCFCAHALKLLISSVLNIHPQNLIF